MNLIIYNPKSGKKNSKKEFIKLYSELQKNSITMVYETAFKNSAKHYIENITNIPQNIFIMGGDGTVHEVINGMMKNKNKDILDSHICHVPIGSGNAIATSLNIYNVNDALIVYARDHVKKVDLTKIEGNNLEIYSVLNILYGMISDIDIQSEWLRCLGELRFAIYAIWLILFGKTYDIILNDNPITIRTLVYTNFKHLTRSDIIDSSAEPVDGKINYFLCMGCISIYELFKIFICGFGIKSRNIFRGVADSFTLNKCKDGLNIDGELYTDITDAKCTVVPNVINFLYKDS